MKSIQLKASRVVRLGDTGGGQNPSRCSRYSSSPLSEAADSTTRAAVEEGSGEALSHSLQGGGGILQVAMVGVSVERGGGREVRRW
jgi:hypothetical protein